MTIEIALLISVVSVLFALYSGIKNQSGNRQIVKYIKNNTGE